MPKPRRSNSSRSKKSNTNAKTARTARRAGGGTSSAAGGSSRGHLLTEQRNKATYDLDTCSVSEAFDLVNAEDASVPAAVARAKRPIVQAVQAVADAWRNDGRLIYVGAGTSGRLGVLDAAECPPTFRSDPKMVRGIIAGGHKALRNSVEGAEDDPAAARLAIQKENVTRADVVMGIATGGTTPYVHAAMAEARSRGATTIFFACVPRSQVAIKCDIDIRVLTGPEVLTGSTRMKAGTATKLVLNTITTLAMVRIGKTHGNLMVDLNTFSCDKLVDRATRVIASATGLSFAKAGDLLYEAHGGAKAAIIMHHGSLTLSEARSLLARHAGHVSAALRATPSGK